MYHSSFYERISFIAYAILTRSIAHQELMTKELIWFTLLVSTHPSQRAMNKLNEFANLILFSNIVLQPAWCFQGNCAIVWSASDCKLLWIFYFLKNLSVFTSIPVARLRKTICLYLVICLIGTTTDQLKIFQCSYPEEIIFKVSP